MARDNPNPDSGKYNRPATIEAPDATWADNGQGGNSNAGTWITVIGGDPTKPLMIHLYSAPNGRGSSRLWKYMQLYPEARHWVELRYRSDTVIDGTMRLTHDGRHYQILDAIDMDMANTAILLPLVEYQAQGTRKVS
jgi:hypothetical protein